MTAQQTLGPMMNENEIELRKMLTYIRDKPRTAQAIKSQAAIEWALGLRDGGKWLSYAELEAALHRARAHPDYSYSVVPAGDQATFALWSEGGGWEPNQEFATTPGDTCWRRRTTP